MNLPLLCVVLPLAALLFIFTVMFAYHLHKMSTTEFAVIWGGLYWKPQIYVWCVTYLLSSLGGLLTFYLCVVFTGDDNVYPVFIFAALDVSFIVYLYVVGDGYSKVTLVRSCLWFNVILYVMLFVYMVAAFPLDRTDVSNATLIGVMHFCNAVAVFHALVMDAYLWFEGWVSQVEAKEMNGVDESFQ